MGLIVTWIKYRSSYTLWATATFTLLTFSAATFISARGTPRITVRPSTTASRSIKSCPKTTFRDVVLNMAVRVIELQTSAIVRIDPDMPTPSNNPINIFVVIHFESIALRMQDIAIGLKFLFPGYLGTGGVMGEGSIC
jgi:hypothetical protein